MEQFLADFLLLFLPLPSQHACKGILPRFFAHAHSCVDTERLFSLERAFRAICAYCKRLYDDHVLPRSHQRALCARATLRTFRRAHPLRSGCICFEKMRRTFLSPKLKKRARPLYFVKKVSPCRFRRHGVFSGTAFCRRNEIRPSFRVFYREIRISIRARRRKRLYLPLFRALLCASSLSLSMIVFRKIRAVFAL